MATATGHNGHRKIPEIPSNISKKSVLMDFVSVPYVIFSLEYTRLNNGTKL